MSADPFDGWTPAPHKQLFAHPPAALLFDGNVHVYAVGADATLYHNWAGAELKWAGWEQVITEVAGTPAAVSATSDTQDVFVVSADGTLKHARWKGTWSAPDTVGATLHPGVAAAVPVTGVIEVFGRGLDGDLRHISYGPGGPGPLHTRTGLIVSTPSAVAASVAETCVAALGPHGDILVQSYLRATDGWGGWVSLGGRLTSAPALVSSRPGRLDLFARGGDMSLQYRFRDNNDWGGTYTSIGGGDLRSGPGVAADPETGRIEVLAVRGRHDLGRLFYDGGWGTFTGQGGLSRTTPAAVLLYDFDQTAQVTLGVDGVVYGRVVPQG